ncbi:FAD-dependent oxidoreductase [Embleya sp. NPDC127516]|uniref:FAD-dependent oxidoreductase n=1 Tax=Embleya sp. NPDC127516 TaxID=3363990 RepID=UPI00382352DF
MIRPSETADVVVVGGGAIGLASAVEVVARGRSALVLDRFGMSNDRGGSAGLERQWRIQYAQEHWSRLVLDTVPLWRRLEAAAGRPLVHPTGSLWLGRSDEAGALDEMHAGAEVLTSLDVPFETMSAAELGTRFGLAELPGDYQGLHQADGGVIDVKGTLDTLIHLALGAGVRIHEYEPALAIEPDGTGVTIRTERTDYRCDSAIVTSGPFTNDLLGPLGCALDLRVFEQSSAYFTRRTHDTDYPTWYAFGALTDGGACHGYGHNPWTGSDLIRVAPDAARELPDAEHATAVPDARRIRNTADWVRSHLPGLSPHPVRRGTCLAALPLDPERQFFLGPLPARVPNGERVVVQAAGWAFKFAPMFGRICADLALDGASVHHAPQLELP